jgi:hypothetical protein
VCGPLALVNAGCTTHANVREDEGWRGCHLTRTVRRGEVLLISYCSDCTNDSCVFRGWQCNYAGCRQKCCSRA